MSLQKETSLSPNPGKTGGHSCSGRPGDKKAAPLRSPTFGAFVDKTCPGLEDAPSWRGWGYKIKIKKKCSQCSAILPSLSLSPSLLHYVMFKNSVPT